MPESSPELDKAFKDMEEWSDGPREKRKHQQPAAGSWQEGEPESEGVYFVKVLVERSASSPPARGYDALAWKEWSGWQIEPEHLRVIRFAEINA